jgi:hypothetical protein
VQKRVKAKPKRSAKQPAPAVELLEPDELQGEETGEEKAARIGRAILAALDADETGGVFFETRVYRIKDTAQRKGGDEIYLFSMQPGEIEKVHDRLRDEYGTGEYRIRVRKVTDEGNQLYHNMTLFVEALPKSVTAPAAATTQLEGMITTALNRQSELIERLMARPPAAAGGGMADMAAMFNVFALMQKNMLELAGGADRAPATQSANPFELFKQGLEFAREIGAPGEKGMADIVSDLLKSPILQTMMERATIAPTGASTAPAIAATSSSAPQPGRATTAPNQVQTAYLLEVVNNLVALAAAGKDPGDAANYMFETVPAGMLRQFATDAAMIDQLALAVPAINNYRGFFAGLRQEIINDMLAGDDESETGDPNDDPSGVGGHARNPQNDESHNSRS